MQSILAQFSYYRYLITVIDILLNIIIYLIEIWVQINQIKYYWSRY